MQARAIHEPKVLEVISKLEVGTHACPPREAFWRAAQSSDGQTPLRNCNMRVTCLCSHFRWQEEDARLKSEVLELGWDGEVPPANKLSFDLTSGDMLDPSGLRPNDLQVPRKFHKSLVKLHENMKRLNAHKMGGMTRDDFTTYCKNQVEIGMEEKVSLRVPCLELLRLAQLSVVHHLLLCHRNCSNCAMGRR